MANIFSQNPFSVDTSWTTGTIPAALTAQANNGPQHFRRIVWTNPTTAGDQLTITDAGGNVLFDVRCATAKQDVVLWQNSDDPFKFKQSQWVVSTLTANSGRVLFYK